MVFATITDDMRMIGFLENYIHERFNTVVTPFFIFSSFEACVEQEHFRRIDILVIDTDLENWYENSILIHETYPGIHILFVGTHLEVGYQVYDISHYGFIYKNDLYPYFELRLNQIQNRIIEKEKTYVRLSWKNVMYIVCEQDIIYFERDKRKTIVHMSDGSIYTTYSHIDQFDEHVSPFFLRIHFSYLVNMNYVREYHRNHVILLDESFIPISRKYAKLVKSYFENLQIF
ncbi:MAG: LytR/AlgR family response regulator transcription factor [Floccifex sp.]